MKKNILIIEDDQLLLETLQIILKEEGYKVTFLRDGQSVSKINRNNLPELIILDFRLPGMNGGEVANYLKNKESTKHVPILMLSASNNAKLIAGESGADDFLEKPFDIEVLLERIQKLILKD